MHGGLVPDPDRLPPRFQEHLCEQLVDVATYPHTIGYSINEAVEQNVMLLHNALLSLNGSKMDLSLGRVPAHRYAVANSKTTTILSIKDHDTLDEHLKELRESHCMVETTTLTNIAVQSYKRLDMIAWWLKSGQPCPLLSTK